jgi:methionine transaminase
MSQLANEHGAINLSQGFPDYECSPDLIALVNRYMKKGKNQYAPMAGVMALREKIAEKVNTLHNSFYNPDTEITITAGGTQAIFTALASVIQPNDEVIVFEPAYDCYAPTIKLLGGLVKSFELYPPDYRANWSMVRKLVTSRTRMIIINSPHNPTGSILEEHDIKELISITKDTDILILSDEVYEHLVYDGRKHLSLAKFPELKERSFIVASFGKLFHNTGWKLGYCLAPEILMTEFRKVHQFLVFSANTPMQYAIADFMQDNSSYNELDHFFQVKRDFFINLIKSTRFEMLPCYGSYFLSVSYKNITKEKDLAFAKRLVTEFKVATIPVSAFYSKNIDNGVLRLCFAKKNETLEHAVEKLIKV